MYAGVAAAPKASVEEGEGVPQQTLGKPFVEVQWEMLHHNPSILYFRALLLQIQVSAHWQHHLHEACKAPGKGNSAMLCMKSPNDRC